MYIDIHGYIYWYDRYTDRYTDKIKENHKKQKDEMDHEILAIRQPWQVKEKEDKIKSRNILHRLTAFTGVVSRQEVSSSLELSRDPICQESRMWTTSHSSGF